MNIAHYRAIRHTRYSITFLVTARAVQYITIFVDPYQQDMNYERLDREANVKVTALIPNFYV